MSIEFWGMVFGFAGLVLIVFAMIAVVAFQVFRRPERRLKNWKPPEESND